MWTLVVLALLGCVSASPFLQDTPEVVAERARFMQLWNAQAAAAAAAPDTHVSYRPQTHQAHHFRAAPVHPTTKWTGPVAATIPAGVQGSLSQVADTADVTAARNSFLAAYRAQVAATTGQNIAPSHNTGAWNPSAQHQTFRQPAHHFNALPAATQKWTGPVAATVPAGVNGQLIPVSDTAEVVAARNAFLNSYNAALRATSGAPAAPRHNTGAWNPSPQHQTFHQAPAHHVQPAAQARWTGPVAATIPAGLPGAGFQVAQTADVAAATAAFSRAYNAAVAATTGRRY